MAVLSEEQIMLRDSARDWARAESPVSALRRVRDTAAPTGYDPAAYKQMAALGWTGVMIPEAYGGAGMDALSLGIVLEELGRTLTASPLLSTALTATSALLIAGTDAQKKAWLPKIAAGDVTAALAVDEGARHAPETVALEAKLAGGTFTLNGAKRFVQDGLGADLYIVSARTSGSPTDADGVTLFLVPSGTAGLTVTAMKLADSRGAAIVDLKNVQLTQADVLGEVGKGAPLLERILDAARAGLAAEMLGASVQAFETTLEYMKTRVQFGQTIGSFQALQHRAAELFTELELTRSSVEGALAAIDSGAPAGEVVSLAKIRACDTLHRVSNEMVQLHGGIGMTDAHDAGFYLKRARVTEAAYGSASYHRERFARFVGI